jgi:hypothetical protein
LNQWQRRCDAQEQSHRFRPKEREAFDRINVRFFLQKNQNPFMLRIET